MAPLVALVSLLLCVDRRDFSLRVLLRFCGCLAVPLPVHSICYAECPESLAVKSGNAGPRPISKFLEDNGPATLDHRGLSSGKA